MITKLKTLRSKLQLVGLLTILLTPLLTATAQAADLSGCDTTGYASNWQLVAQSEAETNSTLLNSDFSHNNVAFGCSSEFMSNGYPSNNVIVYSNNDLYKAYWGNNNTAGGFSAGPVGLWYSGADGTSVPGVYLQFLNPDGTVAFGQDFDSATAQSAGNGYTYQIMGLDGVGGYSNFSNGLSGLNFTDQYGGAAHDYTGDSLLVSSGGFTGTGSSGGGGSDNSRQIVSSAQASALWSNIWDWITSNKLATLAIIGFMIGLTLIGAWLNRVSKNGKVKVS